MRTSKHGIVSYQTQLLIYKIEQILNTEFYVRGAIAVSYKIKENKFYMREKNGIQEFVLCIKGDGKYILRPDRRLTDEEVNAIKGILVKEGYLEEIEEKELERMKEEIEEITEAEAETEETQTYKKTRRPRRKFDINSEEREYLVKEIIKEIVKREGNIVKDLVTKVKRDFEEYTGIRDYPYLLIWKTIKKISDIKIEKLDIRRFGITILSDVSTAFSEKESVNDEKSEYTILCKLVEEIKRLNLRDIVNIIELTQQKMNEENKKILKYFCKIILESIN